MTRKTRSWAIGKKAKRGFKGYPVATVCLYGPTDKLASKVAVGIVRGERQDPDPLERWFSESADIRMDEAIELEIAEFIRAHGAKTVVMTDGIFGCPHEEGIDYPEGTSCPQCPYWAGRDRVTKERIQ